MSLPDVILPDGIADKDDSGPVGLQMQVTGRVLWKWNCERMGEGGGLIYLPMYFSKLVERNILGGFKGSQVGGKIFDL